MMKKTISVMIGKGSVNHNNRDFIAENVDAERSCRNIHYCNEPIEKVYHEMFDGALERYNAKQKRADRRIENYYEKIRSGRQEKPFHEIVVQIGDREDTSAKNEQGSLAMHVLDSYYRSFQQRNPQLRVFSAHLHMDEATPHLHIDFVPFITGSRRGLDTRVSLKQALSEQGFHGGTRGNTEWNQWVESEKEALAEVMEKNGIEWEHKGTHEKHLNVLDYKKEQREEELRQLENEISEKQSDLITLQLRCKSLDKVKETYEETRNMLEKSPEFQLPEPQGLMTAKGYRTKIAIPFVRKLKNFTKKILIKYFREKDENYKLSRENSEQQNDVYEAKYQTRFYKNSFDMLKKEVADYHLLRKAFGSKQLKAWVTEAHEMLYSRTRSPRRFHNDRER